MTSKAVELKHPPRVTFVLLCPSSLQTHLTHFFGYLNIQLSGLSIRPCVEHGSDTFPR